MFRLTATLRADGKKIIIKRIYESRFVFDKMIKEYSADKSLAVSGFVWDDLTWKLIV